VTDSVPGTRIAVLVPSSDTGVEIELPRRIGGAASLHVARMPLDAVTPEALHALEAAALEQSVSLRRVSPDLALFACTSGTFLRGTAFESRFVAELEQILGAPVITAARAMVRALSARGSRVRLIASYSEDIVAAEAAYLREHGLEVVTAHGLGIVDDEETARVSPERLLAASERFSGDGADVVMLSCTNLRTLDAIPRIEAALGLPAVSSNSALAEAALAALRASGSR
jgi:maleate isomerase